MSLTFIQLLDRAANRCYSCALKRQDSDPMLADELKADGAAIRTAIEKLEKMAPKHDRKGLRKPV